MFVHRIAPVAACAALIAGTAAHAADPVATATLMDQDGEAGAVKIFDTADGLLLRANVSGLQAGWHGFHIHETGTCEGDFTSAGGHYAPDGEGHGFYTESGGHAGDLPNIHANADGEARADFHTARVSLDGETAPLMDDDGSAIIVHANADSYETEAGAGARVACGVIQAAR